MGSIPVYPYGYKLNFKGNKEIEESRAEVVRLIYQKYLEGMNRYQITWYLVEHKILRPRADSYDWQYSMVIKILMDERYAGNEKYPAILSEEIFYAAQAMRKSEKEKYISNLLESCNSKRGYTFSGFIICESCRSKYVRGIQHTNAYVKKATWRCRNYKLKNEGKCKASGNIYEEVLEDVCLEAYNRVLDLCASGTFKLQHDSKLSNSSDPSLDVLINETLDQMKSADQARLSTLQNDLNILISKRTALDWEAAPLNLSDYETEKILAHFQMNPEPMNTFEADNFKSVFSSITAQEPGKLKLILKNGNEIFQEYKPMRGQINNAKKHRSYSSKAD
jgi:site-specific DNA recombinase